MFDRLLKAFSPRDKKSESRPLLRFTVRGRKTHDGKHPERSRLRRWPQLASAPAPNPALERSQDDSLSATYQSGYLPSVDIHRHGEEQYPKGDSPLINALRERSRSSPPPRTRAPTPHPNASKPHNLRREKTVRWGSPLEVRLGTAAEEEGKTTTDGNDPTAPTKKPTTRTTQRDGDTPSGYSAMEEEEVRVTANEARPLQSLRRNRRSSIPRPKPQVSNPNSSKPTALAADTQKHMPAPLCIPTKRQSRAEPVPSFASVPVINEKPKDKSSTTDSSRKKESTNAEPGYNRNTRSFREYSFEKKPEVLPTSSRFSRLRHDATKTDSNAVPSKPTSYLKCEPRRPRFANAVRTQTANVVKPTVALAKSCTTPAVQDAKGFWKEVDSNDNGDSVAFPCRSKHGIPVIVKASDNSAPSKPPASAIPVSYSSSSFHAAKSFWSELSTTSSCDAVVSGSSGKSSVIRDVCKTSKVVELSAYTASTSNSNQRAMKKQTNNAVDQAKAISRSRIPRARSTVIASTKTESGLSQTAASSVASYYTTKTHLAPSNVGGSTTSATASVATSSSMQADYTPSIQSQLWNDLMDFCTPDRDPESKLSSCAPYCACDDCLWQNEIEVDLSSTVARVGRR
ncbi:hypothetical protein QBC45DRAFT_471154 [Copromyces sp. CBS 386.78]|nr:hypothetical protein QBC45DRAFT_471154 [Copromyces sp. CBS 386.78]